MSEEPNRLVVKRFPEDLHQRLRVVSAQLGIDMRVIAIDGITARLERLELEALPSPYSWDDHGEVPPPDGEVIGD